MAWIFEVLSELIHNMMHSTLAGTVGVSLIFIYMAWIVGMALFRINEGCKKGHH
ncbi:MAG: hypothetical protein ACNI3A_04790 [Desulfovibrio sp.]|uniref:hypothetical protein n=1 Tax=Desulfovibrio sp. 7SRBS1 TaxID=3378064 RepID=UPI003B3BEFCD